MRSIKAISPLFLILLALATPAYGLSDTEWKIRGALDNRYDKVYRRPPNTPLMLTDHFRIRAAIEGESRPTERLYLSARPVMTKYWNLWLEQDRPASGAKDFAYENRFEDSDIYFETVFFRFQLMPSLSLSGGRLPTLRGAPETFHEPHPFQSSLPKLTFAEELDGALVTLHSRESQDEGITLRLVYAPSMLLNYSDGTSPTYAKPKIAEGTKTVENLAPTGMILADYRAKDAFGSGAASIGAHFRWTNYMPFPDSEVSASRFDPAQTGRVATNSNLKVYFRNLSLFGEVNGVNGTGLDLSASYLLSTTTSEGLVRGTGAFAGQSLGGFGTNEENAELTGSIILLSGRYRFGDGRGSYLGGEYVRASRDAYYFDGSREDVTGFYETKGDGYHFYYVHAFDEAFSVRLGVTQQKYAYLPMSFGAVVSDSTTIDTWYTNVRAAFF